MPSKLQGDDVLKFICTASIVLILSGAATAQAAMQNPYHKPVHELSLKQQAWFYTINIKVAQHTIHWWHTRGRWAFDPIRYPSANFVAVADLNFHTRLLRNAKRNLAGVRQKIYESSWPAHHLLWLCIHGTPSLGSPTGNEASTWDNHNTGHNGHWGGLQMTPGWLGIIPAGHTADEYTQLQQEQFAEEGYVKSKFSHLWLEGQWGQTIGPCWQYA